MVNERERFSLMLVMRRGQALGRTRRCKTFLGITDRAQSCNILRMQDVEAARISFSYTTLRFPPPCGNCCIMMSPIALLESEMNHMIASLLHRLLDQSNSSSGRTGNLSMWDGVARDLSLPFTPDASCSTPGSGSRQSRDTGSL